MCMRCGYVSCEHCFNPMVDVTKQLPPLPKGPALVNDEPEMNWVGKAFREAYDSLQPLTEATSGDLKGDEPEIGHTFTKRDFEDYASCNNCGHKITFRDNATDAVQQMQAHECSTTPDNGGGL